jgi:hypothetical protein
MELTERTNINKITYLNSLTDKQLGEFYNCKDKAELKTSIAILRQYLKTNVKDRCQTTRIYSYSLQTPLGSGGRLYSGNSLQGLPSKIRGFLFGDNTTDIDMKNAHPTILSYICTLNKLSCPYLNEYNMKREHMINNFDGYSKDEAKTLFLCAINDNKMKRLKNGIRNEFFKNFDKEMKRLQIEIPALPVYVDISSSVPSSKIINWNGSAMNRIMCMYENKILHQALSVLNGANIEICALMFDGIMPYGNHYENEELLKSITSSVNEKFVGLNMQWSYKAHNADIVMDSEWVVDEPKPSNGVWSDLEAAQTVFAKFPHWVCCHNELYVYDTTTGLWGCETVIHNKIFVSLKDEIHLLIKNFDGTITRSSTSYGNNMSLMNKIAPLLKTLCINNDWLSDMQNTSLGKILFANGIYNFKESKFYEAVGGVFNNPDILFGARLKQPFHNFNDEDMLYMQTIKKRFFHDPLGVEMGDYLLLLLSRAIAGDMMKKICFGLGDSNSGKSTLSKAYFSAFGEYVGSFNAENLAFRNTGADEAQQMRWLYLLRYKRILFSNEVKMECKFNGNNMKKMSSGGDGLIARLHGGNETEFISHSLGMLCANDCPKIEPVDDALNKRMNVFSYRRAFVDEPSNEFELKKDGNIEIEMVSEKFKSCLVGLTILTYLNYVEGGCIDVVPEEVKSSKEDWINTDEANLVELFKNDFELTNDANDFVCSADVQTWIDSKKLGVSMKKFGVDMKKYVILHKLNHIENKLKKIAGKPLRVWSGMKHIDEIDE